MKAKRTLKNIKSMRELRLYRQNLEYEEKLLEQKVAGISEDIIDNFTDKLRDFTFNLTTRLLPNFSPREKNHKKELSVVAQIIKIVNKLIGRYVTFKSKSLIFWNYL